MTIAILFSLIISWGIWVTTGSFHVESRQNVTDRDIQEVTRNIDTLEFGQREARIERKELRAIIHKNHQEILMMLFDIKKEVKNNRN